MNNDYLKSLPVSTCLPATRIILYEYIGILQIS